MVFIRIIQYQFKKIYEFAIKKLPIYYKSIHYLPVYNWFMIQKGYFDWLYKTRKFKFVPRFFYQVAQNMLYEFDKLDVEILRKKAQIAVLKSQAARNNDKSIKFQADILEKELNDELSKNKNSNSLTIDGFIDYIELTFSNIGSLDPFKLTTARAFSLYQKAIEKNEHLAQLYKTN
jgi:hypothetical protein